MTDNNFEKIKKIMKIIGGKVILVEDGKPTMVMIDIDEYFDFNAVKENFENKTTDKEGGDYEKINSDINVWKKKQEKRAIKQIENNLNLGSGEMLLDEKDNEEIIVDGL